MKLKDSRMKMMNELLSGMKVCASALLFEEAVLVQYV
jgi:hypothetical protein